MKSTKNTVLTNLKYDLPAGLVVFLVALPLCLGISLASGGEAITGVLAGIVGGIVVGMISGSQIGVSGPAAGLATIILSYLNREEMTYEIFLVAVVVAGVFQVILGYIKAGVIADYFPSNVIKGMLAAIGILLVLKQIPHGLGDDKDADGEMAFSQGDGKNTFTEILDAVMDIHLGAFIITMTAIVIIVLWQTDFFKKNRILKLIPAPLVVVASGVIVNYIYGLVSPDLMLKPSHLVNIPIKENVADFFTSLHHPDFSSIIVHYRTILEMGFTIAVVASLESLLSVEASDKLDPMKRITPPNKELVAQGIGNIVVGLIGGLPVTQVVVRSSANVNSGGRTKVAAIFHGVLLLCSVLFLPHILNLVPLACLAGILIMIGYKLANVSLFKNMYKLGFRQFFPFVITILAIIGTDLLKGIIVGLVVSIFYILQNNRTNEPFDVRVVRHKGGKKKYDVFITLQEEITYLSKHVLMLSLHDVPKHSHITIDASEARFVSEDVLEGIREFTEYSAKEHDIDVVFKEREIPQYAIDDSILDKV